MKKICLLIADDLRTVLFQEVLSKLTENSRTNTVLEVQTFEYWTDAYDYIHDGSNQVHIAWVDFLFDKKIRRPSSQKPPLRVTEPNAEGLLLLLELKNRFGPGWPFRLYTTQAQNTAGHSYDSKILGDFLRKEILEINMVEVDKTFKEQLPELFHICRQKIVQQDNLELREFSQAAQRLLSEKKFVLKAPQKSNEVADLLTQLGQQFGNQKGWTLDTFFPLEVARIKEKLRLNQDEFPMDESMMKTFVTLVWDHRPILELFTYESQLNGCMYRHAKERGEDAPSRRRSIAAALQHSYALIEPIQAKPKEESQAEPGIAKYVSGQPKTLTLHQAVNFACCHKEGMAENNMSEDEQFEFDFSLLFHPERGLSCYLPQNVKEQIRRLAEDPKWISVKLDQSVEIRMPSCNPFGSADLSSSFLGSLHVWVRELYEIWLRPSADSLIDEACDHGATNITIDWNLQKFESAKPPYIVSVFIAENCGETINWSHVKQRASKGDGKLFGHVVERARTWCTKVLWHSCVKDQGAQAKKVNSMQMFKPGDDLKQSELQDLDLPDEIAKILSAGGCCFEFQFTLPATNVVFKP